MTALIPKQEHNVRTRTRIHMHRHKHLITSTSTLDVLYHMHMYYRHVYTHVHIWYPPRSTFLNRFSHAVRGGTSSPKLPRGSKIPIEGQPFKLNRLPWLQAQALRSRQHLAVNFEILDLDCRRQNSLMLILASVPLLQPDIS